MFRMFGFFCPRKIKIIVLINREVLVSKVALISTKRQQLKIYKELESLTYKHLHKASRNVYFVSLANMNSFYFYYNNNQVACTMRIIFALLQHFNDACKDSSQ